jgi:hypothetical protein
MDEEPLVALPAHGRVPDEPRMRRPWALLASVRPWEGDWKSPPGRWDSPDIPATTGTGCPPQRGGSGRLKATSEPTAGSL